MASQSVACDCNPIWAVACIRDQENTACCIIRLMHAGCCMIRNILFFANADNVVEKGHAGFVVSTIAPSSFYMLELRA